MQIVLLQIRMWIAYSIPRIEDGNNFGVSIQVNKEFTDFIMASICIKNLLCIVNCQFNLAAILDFFIVFFVSGAPAGAADTKSRKLLKITLFL